MKSWEILYKLIEKRQQLLNSAATLDETYEMLGTLPSTPRVLMYSQLWNSVYSNLKVAVRGQWDKYAMKVANDTVERYLNYEWKAVSAKLKGEVGDKNEMGGIGKDYKAGRE